MTTIGMYFISKVTEVVKLYEKQQAKVLLDCRQERVSHVALGVADAN